MTISCALKSEACFFNSLRIREHTNFKDLFLKGYYDAEDNKEILDKIFKI